MPPKLNFSKESVKRYKWIQKFKKVVAEAPPDIWIFASGNALNVMLKEDGVRVMTLRGGVDPNRCIESATGPAIDGGDW